MQGNLPPTNAAPVKSIFQSKTFWGAVLTAVAAIAPTIGKTVSDYQTTGKIDPSGISQIVVVLATTGVTILGRVEATAPVYTPSGLPGPDKPQSK